jgi:NHLM bacteriocin system ABC transporter peptidase/ATP-binding protein
MTQTAMVRSASSGVSPRRSRRVKTPTVLQMEAVECGAAALGIVLGYHGRIVPLEELRGRCGVSRDGTRASHLLKAARSYGLTARGFSMEPGQLPFLPLPAIVFWEFGHFVVVEGFGKGCVYLNDPAGGPRVVTDEEFDQAFTGVVLVFEPGPEFRKGGTRRGLIGPLRRRLAGSTGALLFLVLVSVALIAPAVVIPAFLRIFVDQVLIGRLHGWLRPLLVGMALTALLQAGLTWLQQACLLRLENRLALGTAYRFFGRVLRLPLEFFSQRDSGEIGSRVECNDRIAQLLSGELATHLLNVLTAGFLVLVMLSYDGLLTLVGLVIAGLNVLGLHLVSRRRRDVYQRLLQERGKLMGTAMAGLQTIESLKATGSESDFFVRWSGRYARVKAAEQQMGLWNLLLSAGPPFLFALNMAAILAIGALRVMDGRMTIGVLLAFQSLMVSFLTPINALVALGGSLQEVEGEMNRLDDVHCHEAQPESGREETASPELGRLRGQLELRNVTFGYSRMEPPLIEDLSLTVRPGARVALVGASGSGKSTVARIASGLYRPWSGEVLLDGRPLSEIPRAVRADSMALVDQTIFLIEGSVREVLTLWDATVAEPDMVQAARDAWIHEVIAARPGGYASRVEEGGFNFSGGEQQRLEIARALVNNPSLLILDEATSALDPVAEEEIAGNLRRRAITCLIVAHRLSTIRDCDEIIVLDRGKIVQRGTHDQLMALDGPYRQLVEA